MSTTSTGTTRERLLDAAYDLLVDDGYQAATVQGVARRANLTTGAIYANFANKHELLVQAVLHRWSHSPEATPFRFPGDESANGDSGLRELARLLARQQAAPPAAEHRVMTEVTGAAIRDNRAEAQLRAGIDRIEALAVRAIERSKATGTVDPDLPTDALVALVVNLYLGAITAKSFGLPQPRYDEVLDVLTTLALAPDDGP